MLFLHTALRLIQVPPVPPVPPGVQDMNIAKSSEVLLLAKDCVRKDGLNLCKKLMDEHLFHFFFLSICIL